MLPPINALAPHSPNTPLVKFLTTHSPPSPLIPPSPQPPNSPPPQVPLIGYPVYFNYNNYHGLNCQCCLHNRILNLSLREDLNMMFAHMDFMLNHIYANVTNPQP